ncbi:MAG TPA: hypothetical protein VLA88_02925 [Candidatus Saccharimonadales bacterium]|nr:hypothetical protein [Candidatus Saccharimonadales bacterium]
MEQGFLRTVIARELVLYGRTTHDALSLMVASNIAREARDELRALGNNHFLIEHGHTVSASLVTTYDAMIADKSQSNLIIVVSNKGERVLYGAYTHLSINGPKKLVAMLYVDIRVSDALVRHYVLVARDHRTGWHVLANGEPLVRGLTEIPAVYLYGEPHARTPTIHEVIAAHGITPNG